MASSMRKLTPKLVTLSPPPTPMPKDVYKLLGVSGPTPKDVYKLLGVSGPTPKDVYKLLGVQVWSMSNRGPDDDFGPRTRLRF